MSRDLRAPGEALVQIKKAKVQGFCFGVAITVKKAEETVARRGDVTTLGHVVHNPQMVRRSKARDCATPHSVDDVDSGALFVRAHGLPVDVFEKAKAKGLKIIDATCPMVTKIHVQAEKLKRRRLQDHRDRRSRTIPKSRARSATCPAPGAFKAPKTSKLPRASRVGVVVQSTYSGEGFTRHRQSAQREVLRSARGQHDLHRHAQPPKRSAARSPRKSK